MFNQLDEQGNKVTDLSYAGRSEKSFADTDWRSDFQNKGVPLPDSMPKALHWSIPWSDLMMTMFIFFAILYLSQTNSNDVVGERGRQFELAKTAGSSVNVVHNGQRVIPETATKESMSNLYEFTKRTMEEKDLMRFASVNLVPDKAVRIILAGDLLFDTGKAEIKLEAKETLQEVAEIIRTTPYVVNVAGHTDDVPIGSATFPTNWELSVIRASQVARFLMEEMEIPGSRFFVTGHAYYQPVKPNSSSKNRAANRRVEIILTKERPWGTSQIGDGFITPSVQEAGATLSQYDGWPWNTL